jgi:3-deoxy-D-manno-octulosonate 8-phosphate phosphatase (KDO 8-P phosphatase)
LRKPNQQYKISLPSVARLKHLRLVMLDVDGVLTDGRIIFGSDGTEYKSFDAHDGYGITRALEHGLHLALISGKQSAVVQKRAKLLGIKDVFENRMDKVNVFTLLKEKYTIDDNEACFIGDDEFDLPLLRIVGFSVAPNDAIEAVKKEVDYVTKANGGRGAVRELLDLILKAKKLI